jgi:hypothetical protein
MFSDRSKRTNLSSGQLQCPTVQTAVTPQIVHWWSAVHAEQDARVPAVEALLAQPAQTICPQRLRAHTVDRLVTTGRTILALSKAEPTLLPIPCVRRRTWPGRAG